MSGFTESNITLDFPTGCWFRFEKSQPYSSISGFHYKEMDACWVKDLGSGHSEFYAIELKDYKSSKFAEKAETRVWDIVKKVVDTIQMFLSARHQYPFGKNLETEKNVDLHTGAMKAMFLTIVDIKPEDSPLFAAMKDECINRLKGYMSVWNDLEVHILTKAQAQKFFSEFVK